VQQRLPLILYCHHTSKPFVPQQKQGLVGISLSLSLSLSHLICEQSRLLDKIYALGHKWYTTVTAL
jgi:hypothetical protein